MDQIGQPRGTGGSLGPLTGTGAEILLAEDVARARLLRIADAVAQPHRPGHHPAPLLHVSCWQVPPPAIDLSDNSLMVPRLVQRGKPIGPQGTHHAPRDEIGIPVTLWPSEVRRASEPVEQSVWPVSTGSDARRTRRCAARRNKCGAGFLTCRFDECWQVRKPAPRLCGYKSLHTSNGLLPATDVSPKGLSPDDSRKTIARSRSR